MKTETIFIIYLALVVTPLAVGTIYAVYLFCNSQIKLFLLEKELKKEKLKTEKQKSGILLKIDFHLSKTKHHEQKEIEALSEIKRELENL